MWFCPLTTSQNFTCWFSKREVVFDRRKLWKISSLLIFNWSEQNWRHGNFWEISPSQHHSGPPSLKITTYNFPKSRNFQKKSKTFNFPSKIFQTTKGPPQRSKRPRSPSQWIPKILIIWILEICQNFGFFWKLWVIIFKVGGKLWRREGFMQRYEVNCVYIVDILLTCSKLSNCWKKPAKV